MELTKEQSRRLQQLTDKCSRCEEDVDIYKLMNTYKCYVSASKEIRDYVYSVVVDALGEDPTPAPTGPIETTGDTRELLAQLQDLEKQNKILTGCVNKLNVRIEELTKQNKELNNNIQQLECERNILKIKNKRGGRKAKFSTTDIEAIRKHKLEGKTIKEIANIYNCSVGLVHKLVNEKTKVISNKELIKLIL